MNATSLEIAEIIQYVCDLGDIQMMHVYEAMKHAYKGQGWIDGNEGRRLPTVAEVAEAVEEVESGAKGKNARARLTPLTDFGLFRDEIGGVFDAAGDGYGLILDVSKVALESVQRAAAAFVLRKVYRQMFKTGPTNLMKLAVVLDEAHRSAKDATLPKLMKEGRKYGISVVVASQQIADFHSDVIGNAGMKIIFHTNFPDSRKVAGFLRSKQGQDLSAQIEQLGVGEAFVSLPDSPVARKLYMLP